LILDATLAYLHFTAIFLLFSFLVTQAMLLRAPLDERAIRLLGRVDLFYGLSSALVLLTGFLRLGLGAKGADFYMGSWVIYAKVGLFLAVGLISIKPTLVFIQWRRAVDHDAAWRLPPREQSAMRRLVMLEIHLAALVPVFAVMMARGLGRGA
jgi:putative membrane protein